MGWNRRNRMHDHICLHRTFVRFRTPTENEKLRTTTRRNNWPGVRCRPSNRFVDFNFAARTLVWMRSERRTGSAGRLVNSRPFICSVFYWSVYARAAMRSQLSEMWNGAGDGGTRTVQRTLCVIRNYAKWPEQRHGTHWLTHDASCQRINFQMNKFNRVPFLLHFFFERECCLYKSWPPAQLLTKAKIIRHFLRFNCGGPHCAYRDTYAHIVSHLRRVLSRFGDEALLWRWWRRRPRCERRACRWNRKFCANQFAATFQSIAWSGCE